MPIDGFFGNPIQVQVPFLELSGNLKVKFSRNPKSVRAKLNAYTKQQVVSSVRGNYLYFDPKYLGRVTRDSRWPYNSNRPGGQDEGQTFEVRDFFCDRHSFADSLDMTVEKLASFDVQRVVTESLALKAMVRRSYLVNAKINDTAEYPAAHVVTATAAVGGFLNTGTTANPVLLNACNYARNLIQLATASAFEGGEFGMLMNPKTARTLMATRELREYLMQQAGSLGNITGKDEAYMAGEGLPPYLYNTKVIVDNTTVNTGNPGNSADAQAYVFPDNRIIFFLREGDLEAGEGTATFSTWTQFVYEDMSVEAHVDQPNRRLWFNVTDNFAIETTSPLSAVVFNNIFS